MTHKDIYTKFMIEYDKANVTSSYPSLTEYEVATVLDKAYNALIALKVTGNNIRRISLEGDLKAIEDISPLIKNVHIPASRVQNAPEVASNVEKIKLEKDHLYFIEGSLKKPMNKTYIRKYTSVGQGNIPLSDISDFENVNYSLVYISNSGYQGEEGNLKFGFKYYLDFEIEDFPARTYTVTSDFMESGEEFSSLIRNYKTQMPEIYADDVVNRAKMETMYYVHIVPEPTVVDGLLVVPTQFDCFDEVTLPGAGSENPMVPAYVEEGMIFPQSKLHKNGQQYVPSGDPETEIYYWFDYRQSTDRIYFLLLEVPEADSVDYTSEVESGMNTYLNEVRTNALEEAQELVNRAHKSALRYSIITDGIPYYDEGIVQPTDPVTPSGKITVALYKDIDGDPMDGVSIREVNMLLMPHAIAKKFYSSSHNLPWIKIPACYIENGWLYVVYDPILIPYLDSALVTYIKTPNKFVKDLDKFRMAETILPTEALLEEVTYFEIKKYRDYGDALNKNKLDEDIEMEQNKADKYIVEIVDEPSPGVAIDIDNTVTDQVVPTPIEDGMLISQACFMVGGLINPISSNDIYHYDNKYFKLHYKAAGNYYPVVNELFKRKHAGARRWALYMGIEGYGTTEYNVDLASIEKIYEFECNDTVAEELISLAVAFALENVESLRLNSKLNMRGLEA